MEIVRFCGSLDNTLFLLLVVEGLILVNNTFQQVCQKPHDFLVDLLITQKQLRNVMKPFCFFTQIWYFCFKTTTFTSTILQSTSQIKVHCQGTFGLSFVNNELLLCPNSIKLLVTRAGPHETFIVTLSPRLCGVNLNYFLGFTVTICYFSIYYF